MIGLSRGVTKRSPRVDETDSPQSPPPRDDQRPQDVPGPKRRTWNTEGAFPLLLLGGALLIYAAVLAIQELSSNTSHLPLWGLVGGVGAVITGAGIYSTFLVQEKTPATAASKSWVTVPKAEWESLRSRRPGTEHRVPPSQEPPWWEGPLDRASEPSFSSSVAPVQRALTDSTGSRPIPISTPTRPGSSGHEGLAQIAARPFSLRGGRDRTLPEESAPTQRTSNRPLKELNDAITELEQLVNDRSKMPQRGVKAGGQPGLSSCVDCGREMSRDTPPDTCSGCGQGLCFKCAQSSRSEDGSLRCVECRARNA